MDRTFLRCCLRKVSISTKEGLKAATGVTSAVASEVAFTPVPVIVLLLLFRLETELVRCFTEVSSIDSDTPPFPTGKLYFPSLELFSATGGFFFRVLLKPCLFCRTFHSHSKPGPATDIEDVKVSMSAD